MEELEPEVKELAEFTREFNSETDRGAALTAATYLDERLNEILNEYLADVDATKELLSGFNAPLSTFSARTKACYSLGLIQENEYSELNIIRKIRNEFGHSWKNVSFKNQNIVDLCNNLPYRGPSETEESSTARSRFDAAVVLLLADLLWRVRLVKKEKREIRYWPHKTRI